MQYTNRCKRGHVQTIVFAVAAAAAAAAAAASKNIILGYRKCGLVTFSVLLSYFLPSSVAGGTNGRDATSSATSKSVATPTNLQKRRGEEKNKW